MSGTSGAISSAWWRVVWTAAACGAGCGSDARSGDPSDALDADAAGDADAASDADVTTGPTDLKTYCAAFASLLCEVADRCECGTDGRGYDAAGCVAARTTACKAAWDGAQAQALLGRAAFSARAAADCLDGLAALTADCAVSSLAPAPAGCLRVFVEPVAIGAACSGPDADGRACADGDGICQNGHCAALPATLGATCEGRCALPLACVDGTCAAVAAPAGVGPDGECFATAQCAVGLRCVDGKCAAGPALGAACDSSERCAAGAVCERRYAERTCEAPGALAATCDAAHPCAPELACVDGHCAAPPAETEACAGGERCAAGLVCDVRTTTCVVPPGLGEPCLDGPIPCAAGLTCAAPDLVCVALPGEGAPCGIPDNACAAPLACDFGVDGSVCRARRPAGEPCQNDAICADGTFCDFATGACAATRPEGARCSAGNECGAGAECADLGGSYQCTPLPDAVGAPCLWECGGGLACTGLGGVCAAGACGF